MIREPVCFGLPLSSLFCAKQNKKQKYLALVCELVLCTVWDNKINERSFLLSRIQTYSKYILAGCIENYGVLHYLIFSCFHILLFPRLFFFVCGILRSSKKIFLNRQAVHSYLLSFVLQNSDDKNNNNRKNKEIHGFSYMQQNCQLPREKVKITSYF